MAALGAFRADSVTDSLPPSFDALVPDPLPGHPPRRAPTPCSSSPREGATVPFIARYRKERDGQPRRGRGAPHRSRRRSCSTGSSRARPSSSSRSSATRPSPRSCASGSSRPSTSTRSRTSTTRTGSRRRTAALVAREAGLAAARRLDLELRPRHGDAAGGPDPRAVGLHLPQRGEGRRRRQGRDRGRARHPRGAARRRRPSCARSCAAPTSRHGVAARREGREGEAAQQVRDATSRSRRRWPSLREPANSHRYLARAARPGGGRAPGRGGRAGRTTPSSRRGSPAAFEAARLHACPTRRAPRSCATPAASRSRTTSAPRSRTRCTACSRTPRTRRRPTSSRENVRRLLLEAPFGPKPVLGVDPGIRTGCKLAAVDAAGAFVATDVIHLADRRAEGGRAARPSSRLAREHGRPGGRGRQRHRRARGRGLRPRRAARGRHRRAGRARERGRGERLQRERRRRGRSSPTSTRRCAGAISIARRLQDPLAELVKIEPREHRGRAVPARRRPRRAAAGARRGRRGLRQRRRRQPQHRLARTSSPTSPGIGPALAERDRRAPRERAASSARGSSCSRCRGLGPEGLRAGGRLPARAAAASTRSTTPASTPSATPRSRRSRRALGKTVARAARTGRRARARGGATLEEELGRLHLARTSSPSSRSPGATRAAASCPSRSARTCRSSRT